MPLLQFNYCYHARSIQLNPTYLRHLSVGFDYLLLRRRSGHAQNFVVISLLGLLLQSFGSLDALFGALKILVDLYRLLVAANGIVVHLLAYQRLGEIAQRVGILLDLQGGVAERNCFSELITLDVAAAEQLIGAENDHRNVLLVLQHLLRRRYAAFEVFLLLGDLRVANELVDLLDLLVEWKAELVLGVELQALADLLQGVGGVPQLVEEFRQLENV